MEKTAAAYIRKYRLDQILEERHVSMLELKTWKRRDILLHADTELHHLLFLVEGKANTTPSALITPIMFRFRAVFIRRKTP